MGIYNSWFDPGIVSLVWNQLNIEFKLSIKRSAVGFAIAVDKISGIGNRETISTENPLIDFHLTLVACLPRSINRDFTCFRCSLIVGDHKLSVDTQEPDVVDNALDE